MKTDRNLLIGKFPIVATGIAVELVSRDARNNVEANKREPDKDDPVQVLQL